MGFKTSGAAMGRPDQPQRLRVSSNVALDNVENVPTDSAARVTSIKLGVVDQSGLQNLPTVKDLGLKVPFNDHSTPRLGYGTPLQLPSDTELLRSARPSTQPLPSTFEHRRDRRNQNGGPESHNSLPSQPRIHHPVLAEILSSPPPPNTFSSLQPESGYQKRSTSIGTGVLPSSKAPGPDISSLPQKTTISKTYAELEAPRPPLQENRTTPSVPPHVQLPSVGTHHRGVQDTAAAPSRIQTSSIRPSTAQLPVDGDLHRAAFGHPVSESVQHSRDRRMSTALGATSQPAPGSRLPSQELQTSVNGLLELQDSRPTHTSHQIAPPLQPSISASQQASRHYHSASLPTSLNPPSHSPYGVAKSSTPTASQTNIPAQLHPPPTQSIGELGTLSLPRTTPSQETILMTPSSLAQSTMLKPTVSRQSLAPSVESQTVKKRGILRMFRRTSNQPAPEPVAQSVSRTAAQQYEIWRPDAARKSPESSPEHRTGTDTLPDLKIITSTPIHATKSIPLSIPVAEDGDRLAHVFSPFRYLTEKKNRSLSVASIEARDGTAVRPLLCAYHLPLIHLSMQANTVVGSPTASMHSTAAMPMLPPPSRNPLLAAEEWRNREREEAEARARKKRRRAPPGVVFDVAEETPEDKRRPRRKGTARRRSGRNSEPPPGPSS